MATAGTKIRTDSTWERSLLIAAQLLALITLLLGLQFLLNTTAGSVFLFSTLSPFLILISSGLLVGVWIHQFRRRHSLFRTQSYEPGAVIFRQGDYGDCAYFVLSGEVEAVRELGGKEVVIASMSEGDYFGEMALLSESPRNATIRAVKATRVAALGKENFVTMMGAIRVVREDVTRTARARARRRGTEEGNE